MCIMRTVGGGRDMTDCLTTPSAIGGNSNMPDLCPHCKEREPTYEVTIDSKLQPLCDYCYHILKWKNPEKEYIVETHLSTRESMRLYHQAIKEFLLPQLKELITNDAVSRLLK